MENYILVSQNESEQVVIEDIFKNLKRSSASYPDFNNTLDGNAECSARLMYFYGFDFGEYQIRNGKRWDPHEGIVDAQRVSSRDYSNINFAILNEMMRLTGQEGVKAA